MFAEAIRAGLAAGERTLSRNAARDIISGGLLRFLIDYYGGGDPADCADSLYYTAKAAGALCGEEKDACLSCLMLCSRLDRDRDTRAVKGNICAFLEIDEDLLDRIIAACSGAKNKSMDSAGLI